MSKDQMVVWTRIGRMLAIGLVFVVVAGCGRGPGRGSSGSPASGKGEPIYLVKAAEKTTIVLVRSGKTSDLPLPPEYDLHDEDVIENSGSKPASVKDLKEGHKFMLAPKAKVQLGVQKISLFRGKSLFEFQKVHGEFKIVLPSCLLGIRGTRFLVSVQPDGSSVVRMYEGRLEIEKDGQITALENQATAVIEKPPSLMRTAQEQEKPETGQPLPPVLVVPAGGQLPEFLKDFQGDEETALQNE